MGEFEVTRACESARARIETNQRKDETMAKATKSGGTKKNGAAKAAVAGLPEGAQPFKRPLPVPLTDAELQEKGKKAARLQDQADDIRSKLKSQGVELRSDLKQKDGELRGLLKDISAGTEDRQVACYEDKDYARGKVDIIRTDTGKVVETRAMSAAERQETMPLAKPTKPQPDDEGDGDGVGA